MPQSPPVALSIAGSDCSAGAGIQADLKTFQHFHVHGLTAVTCVVSETSKIVASVQTLPIEIIESQIALLLQSFPVGAIKTGMLHSAEVIATVARQVAMHPQIPLVVDPVMIASSGSSLLQADALEAFQQQLFPLAQVLTPNIPEAAALLGHEIHDLAEMEVAAMELASRHHCAVLLKGGHLAGDTCVDVLADGGKLSHFSQPRIPLAETHGTGCTLSAAICAALSQGKSLPEAIGAAKTYLSHALRSAYALQKTTGPIHHCLNQGTLST
jgi:hydroxymethylpyrimidine/phosphomethylpyrimidine kinase